jgi:Cellulase (glycosyl hydrolase family 5)
MAERLRLAAKRGGAAAMLALALLATTSAADAARSRAAATAPAPSAAPAPLGGVNLIGLYAGVRPAVADHEIAQARALHVSVVRAELRWSALEPARPNQIEPAALAFTDRLVADAAAAGIRVIFTVDNSPCWDSTAPRALLARCVPAKATQANSWPPANIAAYSSVVAFIARRYGAELAAIEIWNEPDQGNQLYFAGPNKVQRYAALLKAAYTAIKQANPAVPVLGGSLVGSNGQFLRALYAAGIKGYYDGLAVHFYSLVLASLRAIREVQVQNGDTRPLWLDEFGWSSCFPRQRVQEEQACVTDAVQARNLANVTRSLSQTPWLAAEAVYNLRNAPGENFGLTTAFGGHKPAFAALAKALLAPAQPAEAVKLALTRQGGRVVASGSAPVGDYMQLEEFVSGALRYRALFILDRFDHYRIALPAVLGTSGLQVRVFQYWAGAGRAAVAAI